MIEVDVDLREAANGTTRLVEVPRALRCEVCEGTGILHRTVSGVCLTCEGVGQIVEQTPVTVSIPPGASDGERIRLPAGATGDVPRAPAAYVQVRVEAPRYDRFVRYAAMGGLATGLAFLVFLLSY